MTVEESRMPYTEYPIYYRKFSYLPPRKLYAQTLESSTFFGLSDHSYGYFTPEKKSVFNPTAENSPVPLAPWLPPYHAYTTSTNWGIPKNPIYYLKKDLNPGLPIGFNLSSDGLAPASKRLDIASAGTRPVDTDHFSIEIPPTDFYPNGTGPDAIQYSTIDIVIYVARRGVPPSPELIVERQYFIAGSTSSTPDKTETVYNKAIPNEPYFVFNFAVCAPGAPGVNTGPQYSIKDSDSEWYLCPGGGSGAGAQFTAILYTNSVPFDSPYTTRHTDKITVRYELAAQSYSSSAMGFNPSSASGESDNGIDLLTVTADLHYTKRDGCSYPYLRRCTLPGGLIYPGRPVSYSDNATPIIEDFINYKDSGGALMTTSFVDKDATTATALIFHEANWMLPPSEDSLFVTSSPEYKLSQPFTVFNPEGLFPGTPTTVMNIQKYSGASGRPSILYDGSAPDPILSGNFFAPVHGYRGSGGTGSIRMKGSAISGPYLASGGPATIVLSW